MSQIDTKKQAKVIWLTGLSGAGKSTIAQNLARNLAINNHLVRILDGDELRKGPCKDLGFGEADRKENIRRTAEMAKHFVNDGYNVIVALISPYREDRQKARILIGADHFIEVFIDTPIQVCIERDPKGLYAKAAKGEIKNFTGLDAPYETPVNPEVTLNTEYNSVDEDVGILIKYLNLN